MKSFCCIEFIDIFIGFFLKVIVSLTSKIKIKLLQIPNLQYNTKVLDQTQLGEAHLCF